jgi:hypothetical protein
MSNASVTQRYVVGSGPSQRIFSAASDADAVANANRMEFGNRSFNSDVPVWRVEADGRCVAITPASAARGGHAPVEV